MKFIGAINVKICFNRVLADERQFRDRNRLKNPMHDGTDCLDHWGATRTLLKYLRSEDFKDPVKQAYKEDT